MAKIPRLAEIQGGHITRSQLTELGVPRRTIEDWAAAGRLMLVHRGVYALGYVSPKPIDRAHAALLACGDRSAIAGASALVLWDIWKRWPARIEVVSARDRRRCGLTVHRSKTLLTRDIRTLDGVRVTSPARTLLDTATRLSQNRLARAINDLRVRRLLDPPDLRDVLIRNPTHPATSLIRPLLDEAQPEPTRSALEDAFLRMLEEYGLPTPEVNVFVAGHRVDALFAEAQVIVELDGWATHQTPESFRADRRRDAEILAETGNRTVRLTYPDVTQTRGQTAARLKRIVAGQPGIAPRQPGITPGGPRSG